MVELKNVSYKTVLCDISFSIDEGDYVAIIGPNGGGKSTLLKLILKRLKKDKGDISLFSTPQEHFKAYNKIGYVAQNSVQIDTNFPATVEEIILTGLAYKRSFFTKITNNELQYMQHLMHTFDILEIKNRPIGDLSGGQRQRVMITRALLNQPKLLILDEPNAGIDEESQKRFYALLNTLNKTEQLTVVFVTHDLGRLKEDVNKMFHINKVLC
ncbi:MAG: metal ABC transporter ATP-binding protein [Arcobacteraceae bacterium]